MQNFRLGKPKIKLFAPRGTGLSVVVRVGKEGKGLKPQP